MASQEGHAVARRAAVRLSRAHVPCWYSPCEVQCEARSVCPHEVSAFSFRIFQCTSQRLKHSLKAMQSESSQPEGVAPISSHSTVSHGDCETGMSLPMARHRYGKPRVSQVTKYFASSSERRSTPLKKRYKESIQKDTWKGRRSVSYHHSLCNDGQGDYRCRL